MLRIVKDPKEVGNLKRSWRICIDALAKLIYVPRYFMTVQFSPLTDWVNGDVGWEHEDIISRQEITKVKYALLV